MTERGIEANLIQLIAIMESHTPTTRKGVQQLTRPAGGFRAIYLSFHRPTEAFLYHSKKGQPDRMG